MAAGAAIAFSWSGAVAAAPRPPPCGSCSIFPAAISRPRNRRPTHAVAPAGHQGKPNVPSRHRTERSDTKLPESAQSCRKLYEAAQFCPKLYETVPFSTVQKLVSAFLRDIYRFDTENRFVQLYRLGFRPVLPSPPRKLWPPAGGPNGFVW